MPPKTGPASEMRALRHGVSPACWMVTKAPKNGMNVGQETCSPCRRASTTWPSSCTRISSTKPNANVQLPNHSLYAAAEMKKPKNLTKTKPHFSAVPPIRTARPPIRSSERRTGCRGCIGLFIGGSAHEPRPIHSSPPS